MDWPKKRLRRLNIATHRDLGYFFSALIIIYCVSGIALNHVDDWNADFIITKKEIKLSRGYTEADFTEREVAHFSAMVGETTYKLFDFPTSDQVKIYYKDASLHLDFLTKKGLYEKVAKRPVFYEFNVIHRNSLRQWKWASDIFGVLLIVITVTGLFILKGKNGLGGRGKWLLAAGIVPPLIAIILVYLT